MSNFFSQPWFLDTAARVLFPGRRARPATVRVEGQRYDVLLLSRGQLAPIPVVDFYEPRDPALPEHGAERSLSFLPRTLLDSAPIAPPEGAAPPDGAAPPTGQRLAPFVDWSEVPSWSAFVEGCHKAQWRAFHQSERKLRKIGRERGAVRIVDQTWDHELLERLLTWKARQLRSTGRYDTFASTRIRQFLHELLAMKRLHLCALYAGDHPMSALLLASDQGRTSCWISGYDPRVATYSPGALIFEHGLRLSQQAGDREFDMLIGDEDYKYHYATHERRIGPRGQPSPLRRALAASRSYLEQEVPWRARLRSHGFALLQDRARRRPLAPTPGQPPAWAPDLLANSAHWPSPRIRASDDCQLMALQAWTDASRSPLERVGAELHAGDRAARTYVRGLQGRLATKQRATPAQPPVPLGPGDPVRVKDEAAILATLEGGSRDGLYYIREAMKPLEGRTFTVERPVKRFYDERTREVIRPRRAVALAGAVCDGSQLGGSRSCDRACLLFWHEDWLERVEEAPHRPPSGARVRIRAAAEIATIEASRQGSDGIAFTPATMAAFCGREARIASSVKRVYDERAGQLRSKRGVFTLTGLSCPGARLTSGDRCDRACTLFWREEWLERLPEGPMAGSPKTATARP